MSNQATGKQGEDLAASFLESQAYIIFERNYRFERAEVDLICFDPNTRRGELVFVEVKTRTGLEFGRPEEAVSEAKQRNIIRAAEAYLHESRMEGAMCRFDVVSIVLVADEEPKIEHFKNAFWVR